MVKEFKGTKGKWLIEYNNEDRGGQMFHIGNSRIDFSYHCSEEIFNTAKADAKLISKAPELLKKLNSLKNCIKDYNESSAAPSQEFTDMVNSAEKLLRDCVDFSDIKREY